MVRALDIRTELKANFPKYLVRLVSLLCVAAAISFALQAIDISFTGVSRPVTEGNYLLSMNAEGTPNATYCGSVGIGDSGALLFTPDREAVATPVAEFAKLIATGGC